MISKSIHGKKVYLEHTQVDQVYGEVVKIGGNCKVNEVFYKETLDVHPSSIVGRSTRI